MRITEMRMEIHRTPPMVYIDQSEAFADVGSKGFRRAGEDQYIEAKQATLEALAKITQEGITLRSIENNYNGVAAIAKEKVFKPMPVSVLDFVPRYGSVKMEGDPGTLEIEWHRMEKLDAYRVQKPVENNVDLKL